MEIMKVQEVGFFIGYILIGNKLMLYAAAVFSLAETTFRCYSGSRYLLISHVCSFI